MGRDSLITILDRCLLILRDAQEQYRQATDAGSENSTTLSLSVCTSMTTTSLPVTTNLNSPNSLTQTLLMP